MKRLLRVLSPIARTVILLLVVGAGTIALVRFAPGFFSDERELDTKYADAARSELDEQGMRDESLKDILLQEGQSWLNGDLGQSRQYRVPVVQLLPSRIATSGLLLGRGLLFGWLLTICMALPASVARRGGQLWGLPFTLLLATPTAAMATACILSGMGGPVLVLTLLVASRDFKFLSRILRGAWDAPHLVHGRAQGLGLSALLRVHILPNVAQQVRSLGTLSVVTALAALIPVEVIFNVPGVGQLAWTAVMNRDMPVLAVVSVLLAAVVALAGSISTNKPVLEAA